MVRLACIGLATASLGVVGGLAAPRGEDAVSLLQVEASATASATLAVATSLEALGGRWGLGSLLLRAATSAQQAKGAAAFNCTANPMMCQAPYNCQQPRSLQDNLPFAVNGHPNVRSFCQHAGEYGHNLVEECMISGNYNKSAWSQYERAMRKHSNELDGSYCFIEGHCTNTEVTDNTTQADAERMCDARFGHEGWAGNYAAEYFPIMGAMKRGLMSKDHGFVDGQVTRMYLKMACSMGNYHCDVQMCKRTYCKMEYYRNKYGHLVPKSIVASTI